MKRLYASVLLMVCAVAAFVPVTGPAAARKPTRPAAVKKKLPVVPGSQYLALGDSVTFGYVESAVTPAPNYHDPASFLGYPLMLRRLLGLKVADAACPGETSSSLINPAAQSEACENNPQHTSAHYRPMFPLHVSYSGSQLAYAVSYLMRHHNVRLVSLMIGANDFFACEATTKDACTRSSELNALAATVQKNVKTILSAIRNKAHYHGQLVIVNYYSSNYASAVINSAIQFFNHNQDAPAKPFHVEIADGFGVFRAAAAHSGGDSCKAGLLTQLSTGGCGIHPSYAGQALLAQAVAKAIKLG
jgi:lysophospholipase L1-like esterase